MKDKHAAGKLVLENVSHSYGQVAVLNNLSLAVNPAR